MSRPSVAWPILVPDDSDETAIRIANGEAAHSSWLIGRSMLDDEFLTANPLVRLSQVVNLDGEIRHGRSRPAMARDAEPRRTVAIGGSSDNSASVHHRPQT